MLQVSTTKGTGGDVIILGMCLLRWVGVVVGEWSLSLYTRRACHGVWISVHLNDSGGVYVQRRQRMSILGFSTRYVFLSCMRMRSQSRRSDVVCCAYVCVCRQSRRYYVSGMFCKHADVCACMCQCMHESVDLRTNTGCAAIPALLPFQRSRPR